ncbi:MAG TPA: dihydrodipicolinate synthase family protein [Gaiellaceae bacterium]|nr:dihydrodipicolinate synthase family protein [Gaiellaceae bacterium]
MTGLGGTVPALVTPFTPGGAAVDLEALEAHVTWLAERGVRLVSPLGTTGEGPSLSLAERKAVIERLATHSSGVRLLPGTGCTALPETIELTRFAVEQGATAALVAPPWYYDATPSGTRAYFTALLEALPEGASVLAYHIPAMTGVPVTDEILRELSDRSGARLVGAKDSSGDIEHAGRWITEFPELAIFPGSDSLAARAAQLGAAGTITLLGNVLPDELEAIRAGDEVERRQRFLSDVRALTQEFPRHAALKHLLHLVSGLPRAAVRPPLEELTREQEARLEAHFHELRSEVHV